MQLRTLFAKLNEKLEAHLNRDHQISLSNLMGPKSIEDLQFICQHKIVPLLQEYFYDKGEKLYAVFGADFVERAELPAAEGSNADRRAVCRLKDLNQRISSKPR